MSKSPDAFRTISEVSEELDIPQHVLRFWESRFPSIRPLKRGGGRRYYRPDDVDLLRGIRELLYGQGYTIKGVQRILKQDGARFVQGVGRGEPAGPRPLDPDDPEEIGDEEDAGPPGRGPAERGPAEPPLGPSSFARPVPFDSAGAATGDLAPAPSRAFGLAPEDFDRLRAALDELRECERALLSLRAEG